MKKDGPSLPRGSELQVERLPDIDYATHPLYRGDGRSIGLRDRVVAYARYAWIVLYLITLHVRHRLIRRRAPDVAETPHLDALRRDGLVHVRMSPDARESILDAAQGYFDRLEARRAGIERGSRNYADGQLDTTRKDAPELFSAIERAFEDAGILPTVRAYLGCRAEVRKATMQINDEWDTHWREPFESLGMELPPTAFFHVDNTYGVVKVIVYASDVTDTSGPFSYVPGTHRLDLGFLEGLTLRATDIWIDLWPHHRSMLRILPRSFRTKAKFGDDLSKDSEFTRRLLANERFATSADGDLLLFDVMGIHRGGLVRDGERRIIQIMMR